MSEASHSATRAQQFSEDALLAMGRRVLATEAEALWSLGHELGESFLDAIGYLTETPGSVIVCGLGKSGHVARKVAATLTATGTPAVFLHAGEAVHGDLGLLQTGDTLLVFSNSGDTREFGVIMRRAKALEVPMVAVTSNGASSVAKSADACIMLPDKPEACPFGSSPTTSSTMMLALGDAIAMTLLQMRGLDHGALQQLHPGGRLGLDLTAVETFMHRGDALPLVAGEMPMLEVLDLISAKGFGIAAVVDEDRCLQGVITDGDLRRHATELATATAGDVMTHQPRALDHDAMAREALDLLAQAQITALFVLDGRENRRVEGLVHIHDLLRLGIG